MQGRVNEKGGGLMQLVSVSYKLLVTPDTSNHVIQDPLEQVLEIPETANQRWRTWSIQVNDAIKDMLDTAQPGDKFNAQVVVMYNYLNQNIPDVQKSSSVYVYEPFFRRTLQINNFRMP